MRIPVLLGVLAGLAACGAGGPPADGGSPTTDRGADGVRDRPPLVFRPVTSVTPGGCDRESGNDANVIPSTSGSECFHFADDGITVVEYGAKRSTSAAPPTAAIDVTLAATDLQRFNALASQCFERSTACPTGQIAIIFEGRVHSAPTVHEPSFTGDITVSGEERDVDEMLRLMNQSS